MPVILATWKNQFEVSLGKNFTRSPSQSIAWHCGIGLSSKTIIEAEIGSSSIWAKKMFARPPSQWKKLDVVACP
jgi:hypothetical protein